ncbi:hypothetical protein GCM10009733_014250 [Nonomuraea maheshkhaliensis]|uniref:XRE family transcriptional regulator n=2 Tax=Nonomuraea maheshkhaliensis TaxID=419590 RepID=A0ABN2EVL3_9ACTN
MLAAPAHHVKIVATALGISHARVSQIENGDLDSMERDTIRAHAAALGGHVDVTISLRPHSVRVT